MQAIHRTVLFCLVTVLYALDSFLCYLDPKLSGLLLFKSIEELEELLNRLLNEGDLIIKWGRKLKGKGGAVNAI
jgi:hypothetical protein